MGLIIIIIAIVNIITIIDTISFINKKNNEKGEKELLSQLNENNKQNFKKNNYFFIKIKMENKIIKNNAISAYLLFGISFIFLFIKNNKNISNDFVKWHTKSAILIHFLMILDIIFFRFYKVWSGFFILNYEVSNIIFMWILIFLFLALFLWIYKAYKWETFSTKEIIKIKNEKNLLDVNKDWNFWEKDKLTIILSYIPFLWQIFSSKYDKHETIKEILKVNVFVTFILSLLFINNYNNLSQILLLIYFIFIAFIGVNLFSRSELVSIHLPN